MAIDKQQRKEMDEAQTAVARNRKGDKFGRSYNGAIVYVIEKLEAEISWLKLDKELLRTQRNAALTDGRERD